MKKMITAVMLASAILLSGCSHMEESRQQDLPELYVYENWVVDKNGKQREDYILDAKGNIRTAEQGKLCVPASRAKEFTCITSSEADLEEEYLLEENVSGGVHSYRPKEVTMKLRFQQKERISDVIVAASTDEAAASLRESGVMVPDPDGTVDLHLLLNFPGVTELCVYNALYEEVGRYRIVVSALRSERTSTCLHSFKETVIEPNVYHEGYTVHTCALCGNSYRDRYVPRSSHDCSYAERIVEPTCTADGYTLRTCTICGKEERIKLTERIPHHYVDTVIEPTCTQKGMTRSTCTECGKVYDHDNVNKKEHVWKIDEIASTCTKKGYEQMTCTVCGTVRKGAEFPLAEHRYRTQVVAPTCTKQGYTEHKCAVCGDSYKDSWTAVIPHDEREEIVKPTCEKEGYTLHTCRVCGNVRKDSVTPKTEHSYESSVKAPDCTSGGYTMHTCKVCGVQYKDLMTEKTPHSFTTSIVRPTCTQEGYTLKTCSVCGTTEKTDRTAKTEHQTKDTVIEPTFTTGGYTEHVCQVCGAVWRDTDTPVRVCSHDYEAKVKEAACTEGGYTDYRCRICGDAYRGDETAAKGHQTTDTVVAPTRDSEGYTEHRCTVCGYSWKDTYTAKLPNNGPMLSDGEAEGCGNGYLGSLGLSVNYGRTPGNSGYEWAPSYPDTISQSELNSHATEAVAVTVNALRNYAVNLDGLTPEQAEAGLKSLSYRCMVVYSESSQQHTIYVLYG